MTQVEMWREDGWRFRFVPDQQWVIREKGEFQHPVAEHIECMSVGMYTEDALNGKHIDAARDDLMDTE
jgi:hypothetical protein